MRALLELPIDEDGGGLPAQTPARHPTTSLFSSNASEEDRALLEEASRRLLGRSVDLDPGSSRLGDKTTRPSVFATHDCLDRAWDGPVLLNPPSRRLKGKGSKKMWWCKLACEYIAGRVESAVCLELSLEGASTWQELPLGLPSPLRFPCCYRNARTAFDTPTKPRFHGGTLPTHGSAIVFLPPKHDYLGSVEAFVDAFAPFGQLIIPKTALPAAALSVTAARVKNALAGRGGDGSTVTQKLLLSVLQSKGRHL
jgi:hypothetical protein